MPGAGELSHATTLLDEISRNRVPRVIDGMRQAIDPGQARTGLNAGSKESEAIIDDYSKILATVRNTLAPGEAERIIEQAALFRRLCASRLTTIPQEHTARVSRLLKNGIDVVIAFAKIVAGPARRIG